MTLDDVRAALSKLNLAQVSRDTGIHHNTLVRIKNNENANPSYVVVSILMDYISSGLRSRVEK